MAVKSLNEEALFHAARRIASAEDRSQFLRHACGDDPGLAERVRALLDMHEQNPSESDEPGPQTRQYEAVDERAGSRVGPYVLREQIGEGGFGLVFVAEQQEPVRRKVALKVIKPGMDTRAVVARFEAERQALALMDHPNIARVLDAGTTDSGSPYFVMELVKGMPVTEYADAHNLTPRERLGLFVQVCQAVQHAHQKGIIHRDIKPSNVLVTVIDGAAIPKVIDFGVAKAVGQQLTDKTVYTRFAAMVGTPLYMSPEQAELSGVDVDTRADIYALGVLLYELLTGTTPFDRERFKKAAFDEIRRIIKEEEPPRPSTRLTSLGESLTAVSAKRGTEPAKLAGVVRGELDWVVMKCLEKDRTRRYETATGLAKDVQRYLAGDAVEACPPTFGYRLKKAYRRNRAAVLTGGAFAAVLIAVSAVSLTLGVQAKRAERSASAERDRAIEAEQALQFKHDEALRSEKKAREEADAAGFMLDHFLTDGNNSVGNVQFGVLIDRAVRELDRDTTRSRLAVARIRGRIGQAYLMIGHEEEAAKQLRLAQQDLQDELGPDHLETLDTQQALASAEGLRSKTGDDLLQDVLERRRRVQGLDHPDVIRTLKDMGRRCFFQNRMSEAEKLFDQALNLAEKSQGADSKQAIECKLQLASHIARTADYEESIRLTQEAFESAKKRNAAADEPFLLWVERYQINYGSIQTGAQSDYKRRAEAFIQLLPRFEKCFGPDHPSTLMLLDDISLGYTWGKLFKDAEPYSREYLERRIRVHGGEADSVQRARWIRGETLLGLDRTAEAKAVLIESLDRIKKHKYRTVYDQATLGQCYLKEKDYRAAETNLTAGYETIRAYFPGQKMSVDRRRKVEEVLHDLIAVSTALNKPDEMRKWQKELDELPR